MAVPSDRRRTLVAALWAMWALFALVAVVDIVRGEVPIDYEFYWRAAEALQGKGAPYAPEDFPIGYPPGSLYLFKPLAVLGPVGAGVFLALLLWGSAAFGCHRWASRFDLPVTTAFAAALSLMFFPLLRGLEPLNISVATFAMLAWYAPPTSRERPPLLDSAVSAAIAFVLAMKPHWVLIAGPMLLLQRRWWALGGLVAGGAALLGASLWHEALWDAFLYRIEHEVETHWTFDIWRLSPWLGGASVIVWLGAVLAMFRVAARDSWVFALSAIVVWPRPSPYDYVVLLPLVAYAATRAPRLAAGAFAVFSTPLGFLAILDRVDGAVAMEIGYTWRTSLLGKAYFITGIVLTFWAARAFLFPASPKLDEDDDAGDPRP